MKKTLVVLAGWAVAVALPALAGAGEAAQPAKSKAKSKKASVAATAKAAPAEEPAEVEDPEAYAADDAAADVSEPRRTIKVLENPYDISSFYRQDGGGGSFMSDEAVADRYPIAGFYRAEGGQGPYSIAGFYRAEGGSGGHPIAGFYRQGGGRGRYGSFWNSGYGAHRRGRVMVGYRRSIGENGDIFLIAPFLAPVGPLSEAFLR